MPLIAVAAAVVAGCGDDFGPFEWDDTPLTATIYSLARPELLGRPSAYDFINLIEQRVEVPGATGNWDVALTDEGGQLVLVPASVVSGVSSRAGIAVVTGRTFDEVERAPGDSASYAVDRAVPIRLDEVYVVRSRRRPGTSCLHYARVQPVEVDGERGSLHFRVVRNPACNDRALVPPESS